MLPQGGGRGHPLGIPSPLPVALSPTAQPHPCQFPLLAHGPCKPSWTLLAPRAMGVDDGLWGAPGLRLTRGGRRLPPRRGRTWSLRRAACRAEAPSYRLQWGPGWGGEGLSCLLTSHGTLHASPHSHPPGPTCLPLALGVAVPGARPQPLPPCTCEASLCPQVSPRSPGLGCPCAHTTPQPEQPSTMLPTGAIPSLSLASGT